MYVSWQQWQIPPLRHCYWSGIFLEAQLKKSASSAPRSECVDKYSFSKNHRELKNYNFLKICKYRHFISRNNHQKENSKYIFLEGHSYEIKDRVCVLGVQWIDIGLFKFPRMICTNLQCCRSASIIMRIRIRNPKNFHMDPDQDPRG